MGGGCYWHLVGKGRDTAKYPKDTDQVSTTKNHPDRNVDNAEYTKTFMRAGRGGTHL